METKTPAPMWRSILSNKENNQEQVIPDMTAENASSLKSCETPTSIISQMSRDIMDRKQFEKEQILYSNIEQKPS